MKRILLLSAFSFSAMMAFSQGQIGNSDFEQWDGGVDEPINWNSFLTAQGTWSGVGGDQVDASTDVRPGSSGVQSALIFSNVVLGVTANGNLTTGRINMGSTNPTNSSNYNISLTGDTLFSEGLTDTPDSIVFWAKFVLGGATTGNARMKTTLHTNYDYRDPEDAGSTSEVVATAVINFPETGGSWMRFSVPFDYSGPASVNEFILVTFTTNQNAGEGNDNDQLWIDDVELIYNSTSGIEETATLPLNVYLNENYLFMTASQPFVGEYAVYNMAGEMIIDGQINGPVLFDVPNGTYIVKTKRGDLIETHKVVKL